MGALITHNLTNKNHSLYLVKLISCLHHVYYLVCLLGYKKRHNINI